MFLTLLVFLGAWSAFAAPSVVISLDVIRPSVDYSDLPAKIGFTALLLQATEQNEMPKKVFSGPIQKILGTDLYHYKNNNHFELHTVDVSVSGECARYLSSFLKGPTAERNLPEYQVLMMGYKVEENDERTAAYISVQRKRESFEIERGLSEFDTVNLSHVYCFPVLPSRSNELKVQRKKSEFDLVFDYVMETFDWETMRNTYRPPFKTNLSQWM